MQKRNSKTTTTRNVDQISFSVLFTRAMLLNSHTQYCWASCFEYTLTHTPQNQQKKTNKSIYIWKNHTNNNKRTIKTPNLNRMWFFFMRIVFAVLCILKTILLVCIWTGKFVWCTAVTAALIFFFFSLIRIDLKSIERTNNNIIEFGKLVNIDELRQIYWTQ